MLAISLVISFTILSAVILLFAPSFTIVTWVGYAFMMIAFIFTTLMTLLSYGNTDNGFTKLPVIRATIGYVIITVIAAIVGTFVLYELDWHDFLHIELVLNTICWCVVLFVFLWTHRKKK